MMQSIAAFVFRRYGHGDHFPLNSAQRTFSVHQLSIQVHSVIAWSDCERCGPEECCPDPGPGHQEE